MTPRREAPLHLAALALVAVGYVIVRVGMAPTGGFLRFHLTDLLAGAALPSLLALVLPASTPVGAWARTLAGKLALTASATMVWEVAQPILSSRSTGDWVDVACYLAGTLLQHLAVAGLLPLDGGAPAALRNER